MIFHRYPLLIGKWAYTHVALVRHRGVERKLRKLRRNRGTDFRIGKKRVVSATTEDHANILVIVKKIDTPIRISCENR